MLFPPEENFGKTINPPNQPADKFQDPFFRIPETPCF